MALLYPWATREYLLWNMSLSQIILYLNLGHEQKYGKPEKTVKRAAEMTYDELAKVKAEIRKQYGDGAVDENIGGE